MVRPAWRRAKARHAASFLSPSQNRVPLKSNITPRMAICPPPHLSYPFSVSAADGEDKRGSINSSPGAGKWAAQAIGQFSDELSAGRLTPLRVNDATEI